LRTHAVTVYTDLADLPGRYEELFRQAGTGSLDRTLPWFRNFIQSGVVPKDKVRIFAVDAAGILPGRAQCC